MNPVLRPVVHVLLISPYEIARSSLRCLLESNPGIRVAAAATCSAALKADVRPSVLLFDEGPDSPAGVELLQVVEAWEHVPLLILTGTRDADAHCAFMQVGVMGLVLKTDPVENLLRAIERLNAREVWFEQSLMEGILTHLRGQHSQHSRLSA